MSYNLADKTKDSRNFFIGFCKSNGLRVMNSLFDKSIQRLITYIEKVPHNAGDKHAGPPYNTTRYAQLDYALTKAEWERTMIDCQSRPEVCFDSDHFFLEMTVSIT